MEGEEEVLGIYGANGTPAERRVFADVQIREPADIVEKSGEIFFSSSSSKISQVDEYMTNIG